MVSPTIGWPNPGLQQGYYLPGITGLFTGQKTVDAVLKDMDDHWFAPK